MDFAFWVIVGIFAIINIIMVAVLLCFLASILFPQKKGSDQKSPARTYTSYDTIRQINEYKAFSKLPIYKQLLNLKGERDQWS